MDSSTYLLQAQEQQPCLYNWGLTWGSYHQEIKYLYLFYLLVPNCSLSCNETCGHTPDEECWLWGQCCLKEQGQNISTLIPEVELISERDELGPEIPMSSTVGLFLCSSHLSLILRWNPLCTCFSLTGYESHKVPYSHTTIYLRWVSLVNHKGQQSIHELKLQYKTQNPNPNPETGFKTLAFLTFRPIKDHKWHLSRHRHFIQSFLISGVKTESHFAKAEYGSGFC